MSTSGTLEIGCILGRFRALEKVQNRQVLRALTRTPFIWSLHVLLDPATGPFWSSTCSTRASSARNVSPCRPLSVSFGIHHSPHTCSMHGGNSHILVVFLKTVVRALELHIDRLISHKRENLSMARKSDTLIDQTRLKCHIFATHPQKVPWRRW